MEPRRVASVYLALQALAAAVWWAWVAASPAARERFSLPGDAGPTVLTFVLPDALLFVGGSAAATWAAARGRRWAPYAGWAVAGAAAYAALWCLGAAVQRDASRLAAAAMLAAAVGSALAAATLTRAR